MSGLTRFTRFAAIARITTIVFLACAAAAGHAQAGRSATDHTDSRVDLYGGYGYFHPLNSGIDGYQYQDVSNPNATVGVSAFFNKYVGLQIEGGYFSGNREHAIYNSSTPTPCTGESCSQLIYTTEAGPVLRLPLGAFVPFIHTLGGGARINGPTQQPLRWGWGVSGGGGVDYVLPPFNHRLALRAEGDWQYSQVVYGPLVLPAGTHGGFGEIDAIKFSGGLVVRFGEARDKPPVQLGCSVQPVSGFPGDPLKINGTTLNTNPKLKQVLIWTTEGGKIVGGGLEPALDTTGLKPGEYVVRGHLSEGTKAREQATCDAPFTIRAFEPPTIACTATPNVVTSGDDVSISTTGGSPQNRPLTYSYSASAGVLTSSGPTAKLTTAGLSPAEVTITCNVVDDLGQAAVSTTQVTVNAAAVPVVPSTRSLCGLSFVRDKRRPTRVDNEAKGCLDDLALTLNKETDAHLVIVGNYDPTEKEEAGAERTLNARQYLIKEKGIDTDRITLRIGDASGKTVTDTLVPSGAVFNDIGTHTFDESTIVRKGPAYGIPKASNAKKGRSHHKIEPAAVPVVEPGVAPASVAPASPASSSPPAIDVVPTGAVPTGDAPSAPSTAAPTPSPDAASALSPTSVPATAPPAPTTVSPAPGTTVSPAPGTTEPPVPDATVPPASSGTQTSPPAGAAGAGPASEPALPVPPSSGTSTPPSALDAVAVTPADPSPSAPQAGTEPASTPASAASATTTTTAAPAGAPPPSSMRR